MPLDLDEYRKASYAKWDRMAANWERRARVRLVGDANHLRAARRDGLIPQPGDTVLDIAAGTGETGFLAAERIGDGGRLISTDVAPAMVDAARRVGNGRGLRNVEYRVLDAERMDLDDSSVDRALCRSGYMLIADPVGALAETRRVLKDEGRLAFSVWAAPDENPWASITGMVLVERGHLPAPEPGMPGMFVLADPARIRELVTEAGFGEPEIEQVEVGFPYADADQHWHLTLQLAGPLADAVGELDEDERAAVKGDVRSRIEPLIADGGGTVPGLAHVVTAN